MNAVRAGVCSVICAVQVFTTNAQEGQISVYVTDYETGTPVTNAKVSAGFDTNISPGWGWGAGRPNRVSGTTDTNGICVLTGEGNGASVGIAVFNNEYYGSSGYSVRFTNTTGIIKKKWEPWNPTVEVVLKRIVEPISMHTKRVHNEEIPIKNESIGFDLIIGDWVAPHGKGDNVDFLFNLDIKPERTVKIEKVGIHGEDKQTLYDVTLSVRGGNNGDGFHTVSVPVRGGGSALRMPCKASDFMSDSVVTKRISNAINQPIISNVESDMNYFFRVRTILDKDGNVESALYGKIHGDFQLDHHGNIGFTYYLNPTPNDRNVEFDPKKNLFKNLSSSEQVLQP